MVIVLLRLKVKKQLSQGAPMPFPFENLYVYNEAIKLVSDVELLTKKLKGKISYSFIDQLIRASLSIPLNIAEGNGRFHIKEKKNFFWIARGSAFECIPIFQILKNNQLIENQTYCQYYDHLEGISKMLTKLIKSVEELKR